MNNWGGKRKNAGRKKQKETAFRVTVFLNRTQRAFFKSLGGSKWLRAVLESETEKAGE